MFKTILLGTVLAALAVQYNHTTTMNDATTMAQPQAAASIYDFKVPSLDGGTIDFAAFKGKKILIVNTASQCGYTPQYEGLQKLYTKYGGNVVVVGFPANNFGAQEPGSNGEIKTFCQKNYGVTFPMAEKVSVKGDDMAPIFKWLTSKSLNGVSDAEIKWNFTKFLIGRDGRPIKRFAPSTTPAKIEPVVQAALSK